jgi:hypothetical protein
VFILQLNWDTDEKQKTRTWNSIKWPITNIHTNLYLTHSLTDWLTNELTPWSRVFLVRPIIGHQVKNFPELYGIRMLITTVSTRVRHLSLTLARKNPGHKEPPTFFMVPLIVQHCETSKSCHPNLLLVEIKHRNKLVHFIFITLQFLLVCGDYLEENRRHIYFLHSVVFWNPRIR